MAKKVIGQIKLQIPAGKATPAPPVGPALGQHGVNIMGFTKEFNAKTADQAGMIIPVVITVYQDRSFSFITKTPPAAVLLKKAAGLDTASGEPNKKKVATLTSAQIREIAELKMPDLNAASVEAAKDVQVKHCVRASGTVATAATALLNNEFFIVLYLSNIFFALSKQKFCSIPALCRADFRHTGAFTYTNPQNS